MAHRLTLNASILAAYTGYEITEHVKDIT